MQRIYLLAVFILFSLFFSCSKTSGPANGNSVQPNNKLDTLVAMSANIGGSYFHTDSAFGYNVKPLISSTTLNMNLLINATEKNKDSTSTISLSISNFTGPNTYNINPPSVSATYYLNNQRHYALGGQIVIISDTGYSLIGTFTFIADSLLISNGKFNVLMPY